MRGGLRHEVEAHRDCAEGRYSDSRLLRRPLRHERISAARCPLAQLSPERQGKEMFRDSTGAKVEYATHWMPLPKGPK